MKLTRTQLLKGKYLYPTDLISLRPTNHFNNRIEERGVGLFCIPTKVRITPNNIYSGKTYDGKRLSSVVVRLKYSSREYLFICFNPWDAAAKSLWFEPIRNERSKRNNRKSNR